jgi:hypothetical protein
MDALAIPKIHIAARESFHVCDVCLGELLPNLIPRDVRSTHIDLLISFMPPEQKQYAMPELNKPKASPEASARSLTGIHHGTRSKE